MRVGLECQSLIEGQRNRARRQREKEKTVGGSEMMLGKAVPEAFFLFAAIDLMNLLVCLLQFIFVFCQGNPPSLSLAACSAVFNSDISRMSCENFS